MPSSHRFRRVLHLSSLIIVLLLTCTWLLLYLDSVHQRRNAERFISELQSFPFAAAAFVDVRDLVNRHGGTSIEQFPNWRTPRPGLPSPPTQGPVQIPSVEGGPTCTDRYCVFEVSIRPHVLDLPLEYPAKVHLMSLLVYSGIRPWAVYATFEVKDGKLDSSRTTIGQLRKSEPDGPWVGMVPLEYTIHTSAHQTWYRSDYTVGASADNLSARNFLSAWITQSSDAPMKRAFDVDLHCFGGVWRSCTGFSELAPSACKDHQSELEHRDRHN